jgi:hypothetical protein
VLAIIVCLLTVTITTATASNTTVLQVLSGAATSGPERRATIPLYQNVAAGTTDRMNVGTASAAIGRETMDGSMTASSVPSVQVYTVTIHILAHTYI